MDNSTTIWEGEKVSLDKDWPCYYCRLWQPRRGKRSRGRPSRRWQDDIAKKGRTTWNRTVVDRQQWKALIGGGGGGRDRGGGGGLHPAVDGQSLSEVSEVK